ncbi:MAG: pfkB family carbohydrate kinase [Syntrophorhabdus sp. PtaU1.Bin153]|nr:MAG: pfkB family carbohydrate kinase [Syntrophorhabdus sp. PtaU1.Bin153]
MNRYDIVFIGHLGTGTIFPFGGSPFVERSGPVLFAAIAASCLGKRIATVTQAPEGQEHLLEPMKTAGIDLFVQSGATYQYRIVFPTANVDHRQVFNIKVGEPIDISDIPPFAPCLIHLCCMGAREWQLSLMRALKARGFRLSVDMQSFMNQTDDRTGAVSVEDIPEKKEILTMADFVKLDAVEARTLTGAGVLKDQADTLEDWGSSETIITCSEGVLARSKGETTFAEFTNRSTRGRMGRGDTVMGSYLARRLDHSVEDSLRFAAALTSIKMESVGPFTGLPEDVIQRMDERSP